MKRIIFVFLFCCFCVRGLAQTYCTPAFYYASTSCSSYNMVFSQFKLLGSIGMINDTTHCTGSGYENRTSLSCTLFPGVSYVATVAGGFSSGSYQIWIDFNNDGTFQSSESVGGLDTPSSVSHPVITIPVSVPSGAFRMRIVGQYYYHHYPAMPSCPDGTIANSNYYGDARDYTVLVGAGIASSLDSFHVCYNSLCTGAQLIVRTPSYSSGMSIQTKFGDGTTSTDSFLVGSGFGYSVLNHNYNISGAYTVEQILYIGGAPVDSIHFTYNYVFCAAKHIIFFYDGNGNGVKDSSEPFNTHPIITEIDSNGMPNYTISSTGGFYYTAYGNPGDIYQYRVLSVPSGMYISCPSSGIISDTLGATVFSMPTGYFAISCISSSGFDLAVRAVIPVTGVHDQLGDIYVSNAFCAPIGASVTLNFSPKYVYTGNARPAPASTTATSLTWNLSGLEATASAPVALWYAIYNSSAGYLTAGDTVHSYVTVSPTTGDSDTSNNHTEIIVDTVRASCDPNEISVTPAGNILSGTKLHYTVHFENTGTDTAFNIYVMDTLSDDVDISSFSLVSSSATMYVSKFKDAVGHNILKFDFPGINLLDSSYHDLCNAMVMYDINSIRGLSDGTVITGRVGIYFDYNNVVMTNEVHDIIRTPSITLTANPGTTVCTGDTAHFTAVTPNITNTHYKWYLNGSPVGTDRNTYANNALATGNTVKCLLWDGIGDTLLSTSANMVMTVNACPDKVSPVFEMSAVTIFPNPANDELFIKTQSGAFQNYTITNSIGSVVLTGPLTGASSKLNIRGLAPGVYYIRLTGGEGVAIKRFVKL